MPPTPSRSQIVTHPDRAVTEDAWIIAFLRRAGMATIATAQGEQPFISTLLFAYDQRAHAIYFHTARHGRVWENINANARAGSRVCLSAAEMGRLLPAATALNFSVEYQSVVVFGPARLVEDAVESEHGLQLLLEKYFPHLRPTRDYRPITPDELRLTATYRLDVEEWSGKRKSVAEDFPGAFTWGETQ